MELVFEIAGDQIDGARDYQEDAFLVTHLDSSDGSDSKSSVLVIMADGMGGHAAGNIASNLVVSTFNKNFVAGFGSWEIPNLLRASLEKANDALAACIKETPALDGMGCTMVAAVFTRSKAYWVSVGDSHLYLIRDRELAKKNEDHSYGGYLDRMKAQGVEVEPEAGLSRNMLMSAMTGDEIAEVDCPEKPLQLLPGDRAIVCSDGLDTLNPGVIIQTNAWSPSAKECVSALLRAVEDAKKPRQDNTTVVVIDTAEKVGVPIAPPAPRRPRGDTQELTSDEIQEAIAPQLDGPRAPRRRAPVIAVATVLVLAALAAGAWWLLRGAQAPVQAPVQQPAPEPAVQAAPPAPAPEVAAEPAPPAAAEQQAQPVQADESGSETLLAPVEREFTDSLKSGGQGPVMIRVPGGSFQMGAAVFAGANDELPRHRRTVRPFAIGKYEVTIEEYARFARATGRRMPRLPGLDPATHPMIHVSWDDASAYAQWLSKETGERYSLPSEAQWEYAARAGTETPFWWGFEIGENNGHCFDCKTGLNPRQPTRVGRFKPNPFGLYDMAGNVLEWTRDCYHPTYKGAPDDGAVWEGGDCSVRVVRGGGYGSTGSSLRAAKRATRVAANGSDEVGIRLAREL